MESYWLYILLGFFGGMIFMFLVAWNILKKFIGFTMKVGKGNE